MATYGNSLRATKRRASLYIVLHLEGLFVHAVMIILRDSPEVEAAERINERSSNGTHLPLEEQKGANGVLPPAPPTKKAPPSTADCGFPGLSCPFLPALVAERLLWSPDTMAKWNAACFFVSVFSNFVVRRVEAEEQLPI